MKMARTAPVETPMKRLLLGLLLIANASALLAQPARIILIRHGEKPVEKGDPHLTVTGREHARFWATHFSATTTDKPNILFAPKPSSKHPSVRATETLEPLAAQLHLEIRTPEAAEDFSRLADQLLKDPQLQGKTVLVCWVHQFMPQFAAALGVKPEPERWKDGDYDGTYAITFEKGRATLEIGRVPLPSHP